MISTNPPQAESIRVQLSEWKDALKDNFVLEPEGRNTAPAIALVALGTGAAGPRRGHVGGAGRPYCQRAEGV